MKSTKRLPHGTVATAIHHALQGLAERQLDSGEFPVYVANGPEMAAPLHLDPCVFPTALIAHSLSFSPVPAAMMSKALTFLVNQMGKKGLSKHWSENHPQVRQLPPDIDDTCCVSRILRDSGIPYPDNRAVLLENRDKRGLFYTWLIPRLRWSSMAHLRATLPPLWDVPQIHLFFKNTSARPFDVDAVVNANALFYLGDFAGSQIVIKYLLGILQEGRETSCDKWYESPFVVWYFFSRVLAQFVPEADGLIQQRLAATKPTTALETALMLCCMLDWKHSPNESMIADLISFQLPNGLWPCTPVYHGGPVYWGSEELTTGFCIEALSRWQMEMKT